MVARRNHKQWIAKLRVFIISSVAACTLSLAIQILFIVIAGLATELKLLFMLGWAAAGLTGLAIVCASKSPPWVIATPYGLVAAINLPVGLCEHQSICVMTAGTMAAVMLVLIYLLPKRFEGSALPATAIEERSAGRGYPWPSPGT